MRSQSAALCTNGLRQSRFVRQADRRRVERARVFHSPAPQAGINYLLDFVAGGAVAAVAVPILVGGALSHSRILRKKFLEDERPNPLLVH